MATGTADHSAAPPPPPRTVSSGGRLIEFGPFVDDKLRKTKSQVRWVDLTSALLGLAAATLAFVLAVAVVDHWAIEGGIPAGWRVALLFGFVASSAAYLIAFVLPAARRPINPVYAAHAIERERPTLKNSLVNFLLLRSHREQVPSVVYKAIEERAATDLSRVSSDSAVDRSQVIKLGYVLMAVVALFCVYTLVSPKQPFRSLARLLFPFAELRVPTRVSILDVKPGNVTKFYGEFLTVTANVTGVRDGEAVTLFYTTADGQIVDRPIAMNLPQGSYSHQVELPASDQGAQQDMSYFIVAGDATSDRFKVTVLSSPSISVETLEYDYPDYTGLESRKVSRQGDIQALEGTTVTIHAKANQQIKRAHLDLGCDGKLDIELDPAGDRAQGRLALLLARDTKKPAHDSYQLRFTNDSDESNTHPIRHKIEVAADSPPEITFIAPEKGEIEIPVNGTLTIGVRASDPDFSLRSVSLSFQREATAAAGKQLLSEARLLDEVRPGEFQGSHLLEIKSLGVQPGDTVVYWGEARDNRLPEANRTKTVEYRLKILPPADEQQRQEQAAQAKQEQEQIDNQDGQEGDAQQSPNDAQPDQGESEPADASQEPTDENGEPQDEEQGAGEQEPEQGHERVSEDSPGDVFEEALEHQEQQERQEQDQQPDEGENENEGDESQPRQRDPGSSQSPQEGEQQNQDAAEGENGEPMPGEGASDEPRPGEQSGGEEGSAERNNQQSNKQGNKTPSGESGEQSENGESGEKSGEQQNDMQQSDPAAPQGQETGEQSADPQTGENQTGEDQTGENPQDQGPPMSEESDQGTAGEKQANGEQAGEKAATGQEPGEEQPTDAGPQSKGQDPQNPSEQPGENQSQDPAQGAGEKQQSADKSQDPTAAQDPADGEGSETRGDDGQENGEKQGEKQQGEPQQGGDREGEKGEPGAGQPQDDGNPTPAPQGENRPRDKEQGGKQPGQNEGSQEEATSPSTSPSESDSEGGESGDRSGGAKEGGGQRANQPGTGAPGQNTASDQGSGQSQQPGEGDASNQAGNQAQSDEPVGGEGEGDEGNGSKTTSGDSQAGGNEPQQGNQQGNQGGEGEQSGEQGGKQGGNQAGSKGAQSGSAGQGSTQGTGGTATDDPDGEPGRGGDNDADEDQDEPPPQTDGSNDPGADDPNLEYANKQTELALRHLKEELKKDQPDAELLDRLGWSKEDLQRFVERWEEMRRAAKAPGPEGDQARERLEEALKSLGLRPKTTALKASPDEDDSLRRLRESRRSNPPAEYAEQFKAYTQGTARSAPR